MTSVPLVEIQAIADRHGATFNLNSDSTTEKVRAVAELHRFTASQQTDDTARDRYLAIAQDLKALAERVDMGEIDR